MRTRATNFSIQRLGFQRDIDKALGYFMQRKRVNAVWLFGSACKNRQLDWRSDLDFAIKGLLPGEEYEAWSQLDEILEHQMDLVRMEDANPLLKQEILKGVLLYEN